MTIDIEQWRITVETYRKSVILIKGPDHIHFLVNLICIYFAV